MSKGAITGFTLIKEPISRDTDAMRSQRRALSHFPKQEHRSIKIGSSRLEVWGHKDVTDRIHTLPDGSVLALVGSPHGSVDWGDVRASLERASRPDEFQLPWDGRVILLKISADGRHWSMWNDWVGTIPVFHAQLGEGRIASTLEPVTVSAGGFTPDDIFLTALLSLFINGYFLFDWTMFKEMKTVPPDCLAEWDDHGFHARQLWTVTPTQDRWQTGWDDMVDEMHELSYRAIKKVLDTQPNWILPLSSGLDSRLIAGVAADVGADMRAYSWGSRDATDVIYARQIAQTLGFPWKRVDLRRDFLIRYTQQWADLFGSSLHFHGMYVMCFLDAIQSEPSGQIISGYLGDALAGNYLVPPLILAHPDPVSSQHVGDWYTHWNVDEVKTHLKPPVNEVLEELDEECKRQIDEIEGAPFQKMIFLDIWNLERLFIHYQPVLADYWMGVSTPFLDRDYARFCLSLPRAAVDDRRLLADVYRRYYGRLAVIPGTYAHDPYILTGRYLLKRRIAKWVPKSLRHGVFGGLENVQLRMDMDSARASGRDGFWPIFDTWDKLGNWLDINQLENAFNDVMQDRENYKALRKLQSVQALAYRLLP